MIFAAQALSMPSSYGFPDFVAIQRESFLKFLAEGFPTELGNCTPIESASGELEITLYPDKFRLKRPKMTPQEAIWKASTYSCPMYVGARFINHATGRVQSEYVFLGDLPFMTDRGHFVINGSSRVVVNQIVRSPGIYYKEMIDQKNRRTFVASIISDRGSWLRLETDRNGLIWARLDKAKKIPILIFLQAIGISQQTIFQSLRNPDYLINGIAQLLYKPNRKFTCREIVPGSTYQALMELYSKLYPDKPATISAARYILYSRFLDPKRYDLGQVGRWKINRKLSLSIPFDRRTLCPIDFLAATDYLINLECGTGECDDIDHLKNRRVRSSGELIQNQVRIGLRRLERILLDRMVRDPKGSQSELISWMSPKPLVGALREFFGSSQLSQFMDQTNPLAEITHKRRLSCLGPGGLSRDRAGMAVREIHPSHYGRICPIETPEGPNAGLIGSLATHARINDYGFLESPFYQVHHSKVQHHLGPIFLSAEQEDEVQVCVGDLILDEDQKLPNRLLPARYQQEFITTTCEQVNYLGVSPIQVISVATSLIPFLEHDDANRALMGSNMQRQAVPLLYPERPIVGTGLESQAALDSGTVLCAHTAGQVSYVDSKQIIVKNQARSMHYFLHIYQRSNQDTCIHQRPLVKEKEWVQRGDFLTDGAASVGGELALGQNILVAYMPWEGYNFEDAILISDRLVYEDIFTSLHIERYVIESRQSKLGKEEFTRDIPGATSYAMRHLDEEGIVKIGSWIQPGDILVGRVTPKEDIDQLPEARLLQAIFGHKARDVRDTSLRVPTGVSGRIVDVRILQGEDLPGFSNGSGSGCMVHVYLCQKRRIQIGDKMAGRHGNKGIVSRILPAKDMPYLIDGTPVDMVLNPLGVPSRMNVGQVFECLLGLAGSHLKTHFRLRAFDEMYGEQASRAIVYAKLYEASKKTKIPWLFNPNHPGKTRVFDGRTGEAFDQPVLVGKAYMLKLVHQVDDKIHARSTGPYSLVTQQPLGGRSKHGGQRFGEMEVWALEGFGASYLLQELLTFKSDDVQGRNKTMTALIKGQAIPAAGTPESFKVLIRELQALCLDISLYRARLKLIGRPQEVQLTKL
uniref:DNA-directed RNA polymerase subunit beta n=1 Tax=Nephroselmis astigmatica TaxID=259378 RepID=A0A088CIJ3_9CHLO|nr:beta subunit of RNA polymerase [Nephroselmis astigmatica]AID67723.1 beta subunit of RNA polymerase [Nephroselmis astigmatica]